MIRQLIKYLWNQYVVMPLTETPAADIIALADQMEGRNECQTLAVGVAEYAEVKKQDNGGSVTIPVLGPARVIIVKENTND